MTERVHVRRLAFHHVMTKRSAQRPSTTRREFDRPRWGRPVRPLGCWPEITVTFATARPPSVSQPRETRALQPVEERHLTLHQLGPGLIEVEPLRPVHLREVLHPAGSRWPLQLEGVADAGRRRRSPPASPRPSRTCRSAGPRRGPVPGPSGSGDPSSSANSRTAAACGSSSGIELPLGDRPGVLVLAGPERPAHVHQQHLHPARREAGTAGCRRWFSPRPSCCTRPRRRLPGTGRRRATIPSTATSGEGLRSRGPRAEGEQR